MGKDTPDTSAADASIASQTKLAERLVNQSEPLRQQLFQHSGNFLKGDFDVSSLPQYAAGKSTIEAQTARARDTVIGGTAEGGGLTSALTNLEGARAAGLVGLEGQLADAEQNRALQLGTFGAAQGQTGFSSAGNTAAQMAAAESQQNAGKASGLGSAAGAIGGGFAGKPRSPD